MWQVEHGFEIKETANDIFLGKGKGSYFSDNIKRSKEFEESIFPKKNKRMFIQINEAGNIYSSSSRNSKNCLLYSVLLADKSVEVVVPSGNVTDIITDDNSIKEIARSIIDDALSVNISNTKGFNETIKRHISSYMSTANINNIQNEKHVITSGFIDTIHNIKKNLISIVEDMGILDDDYILSIDGNRITFVGDELDGKEIEIIYLTNTAELSNNIDDYITQEVENKVATSMGSRIAVDTINIKDGRVKLDNKPSKILTVYVENEGELYVEELRITGNYVNIDEKYNGRILEIVYVW